MIPDKKGFPVYCMNEEDLELVYQDDKQIEALGRVGLKSSLTAVRYKKITSDELNNLYEDGDMPRFMKVLSETIAEFEKRISALEEKK